MSRTECPIGQHVPRGGTTGPILFARTVRCLTGHLTTACGAIEMLVCAMAVHAGVAPPTINYEHPDPECDLDYTPNTAREIKCRYALNNNFGFGGHNVSLVVSRFEN